jgi:hypothetical protein
MALPATVGLFHVPLLSPWRKTGRDMAEQQEPPKPWGNEGPGDS